MRAVAKRLRRHLELDEVCAGVLARSDASRLPVHRLLHNGKGAIRYSDLPSQDQKELWTWLAGCHWQCRHVLGYTALRSESGSSWQCVKDSRRSLVLRGPDDSWIAQAQQETQGPRRAVTTARTLVSYALLVLAAVPMLVLKCSLLMHCLRQCKRVDAV